MPKNRGKITLSQLIQTKRSERPDDHFWDEFSSELNCRMRLETQKSASHYGTSKGDFWISLRKTTTACGLVLTCGVFTFLTYNSMQVASTGPTQDESFGLIQKNPLPETKNQVAFNDAKTNIQEAPVFVVNEPSQSIEAIAQEADIVTVSNSRQEDGLSLNTKDFVMDLPNAFDNMDIEKLVNFDESSDLSGDSITERYMNPLYAVRSSPVQRLSSRISKELSEFDINFRSQSSNSQKLDTITLIRF